MVKMILSYRTEYQKLVLPDSFLEGCGDVVTMLHRGFEDNSISAAREFLNHYNIPFTPLEYFEYEMSNPLFLTLNCKTFGLNAASFVRHVVREQILHDAIFEGVETLYFAFDQMNDYYCAKAIIQKRQTKDEVCGYLSEKILGIQNGELYNSWNVDLFVNACALYAEKYGEECIGIIDGLKSPDDKWQVFSRYIDSFQWRDTRYIPADNFKDLLKKYPCSPEDLWTMLIGNSMKVSHPFNADFLHRFLLSYKLNKRDYLWTIYINELTKDEDNRIVQIIQMYDKGEKLEITNEKQIEQFLTLFAWVLSSSNRWLRDYTSKAMIEILKEHFYQPFLIGKALLK